MSLDPTDEPETVDFVSGIFSRTDYIASQAPPRDFQPWHLPRKQYVRREQWVVQTRKLFEDRADTEPITYLGLPGIDLLDLRYLHQQVCVPLKRPLRFLGFNTEARSNNDAAVDLNTSRDEVSRLDYIDAQSDVLGDDFRSLARTGSMAAKAVRRLGPFDVVNLDLCDGIASDNPQARGSLYDAIAALLPLQVRSPNSWVLLVTTRIGRDNFHGDALRKLLQRFDGDVETCTEFAAECRELLGVDELDDIDPSTCSCEIFMRMTLVSLCSWLMTLGQTHSPNRVELTSCQGYRVDRGSPCEDLVSFALVFKPVIQAAQDALQAAPVTGIDECAEVTRIARRAKHLKDVDQLLVEDVVLLEELTEETEILLRSARYDPATYREWCSNST